VVLSCYGLVSMAILAALGAVTTGIHMFARTAASIGSGGVCDFVVAIVLLVLFSARAEVTYDRGCRAPYRGFLMHAAQSEPHYKLTGT